MCQRPGTRQAYVQWGRQQCTNGHTTEYNGLIMATHYTQRKGEHVCVDYERMGHARSDAGEGDAWADSMARWSEIVSGLELALTSEGGSTALR